MRWVLITAFGTPVEPEVKRNLTMVSAPTLACALSSAAEGSLSASEDTTSTPPATAPSALPYCSLLETKTRPGVSNSKIARSLAKSVESSEYAGEIGA